jgi:hypothetical protein
MKTDYTIKHIVIQDGEKEYLIGFRDGLFRGVQVIHMSGFSPKAKTISTYPPLPGVIGDMLMELGADLQSFGIYISNRFGNKRD